MTATMAKMAIIVGMATVISMPISIGNVTAVAITIAAPPQWSSR